MNRLADNDFRHAAPHLRALLRHFADLRDGTHGNGAVTRDEKERLFSAAVDFLAPFARQALEEINATLLLGSGTVSTSGLTRSSGGDSSVLWTLEWPEQQQAGIPPVTIDAFYGHTFHHPHLRGGTVGVWPLNVFCPDDAAAELPVLRDIAAAELHNLVFRSDVRIIPATTRGGS